MNQYDSEEIDKYLVEFEDNTELYGNDIEVFIEQRNIEFDCARRLRETLQLGRDIDVLAGGDHLDFDAQNCAEDLTGELGGEYRFTRELGRGGMGTVWLAEQLMPQREVAIKLVLTDLDSRLVQRRFETEQKSLALMSHPGIAKVISAGAINGSRPYFVMEYVDGIPVTEYCNENRLDLNSRLDLFLQLCDAIQHAHQKGVIHRDIKPGNILVTKIDGKPQIKVIDFGLSKIISGQGADLHLTQAFVAIGSPLWMSPEQTRWKTKEGPSTVDTRSDIYSLGVILYQLLTNTTPIDFNRCEHMDRFQLFESIRNEVPPYPSRRVIENKPCASWVESQSTSGVSGWKNTLRDDLDWVTMKALEKEPDRRYATVSALADDLRRFTSGKAVVARPPSAIYQLKKYIARNKAVSIATVVAALSVVACLVLLILYTAVLKRESQRDKTAKNNAIAARKQAEAARKQAIIQRESADRLLELYTKDIDAANVYASGVKFSEHKLERMVDLAKEIDNQNLLPERDIKLRIHVAHNLNSLGEVSLAKTEYKKALELAESELGYSAPITMMVRNRLAFTYFGIHANEDSTRYLEINKELLAGQNSVVDPEIQLRCELGLVRAKFTFKEPQSAIQGYRAVITKCEDQLAKEMDDATRTALATLKVESLTLLGHLLSRREEYENTDQVYREAKFLSDNTLGPDSMRSLNLELGILINKDKWNGKADLAKRPEILDEFVEKIGESHPKVMTLRNHIAESLRKSRKYDAALRILEDGIQACAQSASERKRSLVELWFSKILVFNRLQRFSDSIEAYETEIAPKLLKDFELDNYWNLLIQSQIAVAYFDSNDLARTAELIETCLPITKQVEGGWGPLSNQFQLLKANLLERNGRFDDAVGVRKDIVDGLTREYSPEYQKVSFAEYRHGKTLDLAGQPMEALKVFEHLCKVVQPSHPGRLTFKQNLAEHYLYAGKHEQAFALCEEVQNNRDPTRIHGYLNKLRFQNHLCYAEAAAQLDRLDIAQELVENIKTDAEKFKYIRESPAMNRLELIQGTCQRQKKEFDRSEATLLLGLSKVNKASGLGRFESVRNTLAARRYASQLATLYEQWGKHEKAEQFRDKKFPFSQGRNAAEPNEAESNGAGR